MTISEVIFEAVVKPIEAVVYGFDNDSVNGKPRPVLKYVIGIGILAYFLFGTGLVTIDKVESKLQQRLPSKLLR